VFVILRIKICHIPEISTKNDTSMVNGWLIVYNLILDDKLIRCLQNSVIGNAMKPLNWRHNSDAKTVPFR
jgi:hypothetical protein